MRHVIRSESSAGFLARKKLSAGEKSPFYLLKWNICADLVQRLGVKKKSYQQNVSERALK